MRDELEFALYTLAAPLAAAVATAWLARRCLPIKIAERYTLAAALAAGFFTGYWLLPEWAPLVPEQHWQWLPYLGAAAVLGAIGLAEGVSIVERWLAFALLTLVAAWQLVPHWPDLSPPRMYAVPLLAGYLLLIAGLLTSLPDRLLGRTFVGLLTASAATVALLVGLGVSMKYGQVAAAAAAATVGCWAATYLPTPARSASEGPRCKLATTIRGLAGVFAVLAGGSAFVGAIEPTPPMPILLLAPAAPLMLWLFAFGPLSRMKGLASLAAQCGAVLLPLLMAVAWVALTGEPDEWAG